MESGGRGDIVNSMMAIYRLEEDFHHQRKGSIELSFQESTIDADAREGQDYSLCRQSH